MNPRARIAAIVLGAIAIAGGAVLSQRALRRNDERTVRVYVRNTDTPENNEEAIALPLERKLGALPGLKSQRIEITKFGVKADATFDASNENLAAVREAAGAGVVSEAPPEAPAIWIFSSRDLTKELEAIRGVLVETCGEPQPMRVRVTVDVEKLKALLDGDIVELELAVGGGSMRPLREWQEVNPEELAHREVRPNIRIGDIATVMREPRPNRCSSYGSDGKATIAHVVFPLTGAGPDARAKIDAVARDAKATIVHEDDGVEVRYTIGPNATFDARRRIATDYVVRGKVSQGLEVLGSRVFFDGTGSLLVKKPAKVEQLRALIKENFGVSWGGARGAHRLELTIKGDGRPAIDKRTKEVQQRVSSIEGVGAGLMLAPGAIGMLLYEVDTKEAEARGISVDALKLIASVLQGDAPIDAGISVDPFPPEKVFVKGAPFSAFVHMRERPVTVRLFRADQKPSHVLAFEIEDANVAGRVRQALADSADVSVRVVPPF